MVLSYFLTYEQVEAILTHGNMIKQKIADNNGYNVQETISMISDHLDTLSKIKVDIKEYIRLEKIGINRPDIVYPSHYDNRTQVGNAVRNEVDSQYEYFRTIQNNDICKEKITEINDSCVKECNKHVEQKVNELDTEYKKIQDKQCNETIRNIKQNIVFVSNALNRDKLDTNELELIGSLLSVISRLFNTCKDNISSSEQSTLIATIKELKNSYKDKSSNQDKSSYNSYSNNQEDEECGESAMWRRNYDENVGFINQGIDDATKTGSIPQRTFDNLERRIKNLIKSINDCESKTYLDDKKYNMNKLNQMMTNVKKIRIDSDKSKSDNSKDSKSDDNKDPCNEQNAEPCTAKTWNPEGKKCKTRRDALLASRATHPDKNNGCKKCAEVIFQKLNTYKCDPGGWVEKDEYIDPDVRGGGNKSKTKRRKQKGKRANTIKKKRSNQIKKKKRIQAKTKKNN